MLKHIYDQRWSKLDDKTEGVIFMVYHPIWNYKLYNLVTQKVHITKDVIFNESEESKLQNTPKKGNNLNHSFVKPD